MALKDHVQVTTTAVRRKSADDYLTDYVRTGTISKEDYAAWVQAINAERTATVDRSRFPHVCPSCGAASYNGLGVDHADETAAARACALRRAVP